MKAYAPSSKSVQRSTLPKHSKAERAHSTPANKTESATRADQAEQMESPANNWGTMTRNVMGAAAEGGLQSSTELVAKRKMALGPEGSNWTNKTGLPGNLKAGIENLSGFAMDDVRVHYNSPKPRTIDALAYTQGTEIYVAPGQEKHLPHEAWHVVQQMQGRVHPTFIIDSARHVNVDPTLEEEADAMAHEISSVHGHREEKANNKLIGCRHGGTFHREPRRSDAGRFAAIIQMQMDTRIGQISSPKGAKIYTYKENPSFWDGILGGNKILLEKGTELRLECDSKNTKGEGYKVVGVHQKKPNKLDPKKEWYVDRNLVTTWKVNLDKNHDLSNGKKATEGRLVHRSEHGLGILKDRKIGLGGDVSLSSEFDEKGDEKNYARYFRKSDRDSSEPNLIYNNRILAAGFVMSIWDFPKLEEKGKSKDDWKFRATLRNKSSSKPVTFAYLKGRAKTKSPEVIHRNALHFTIGEEKGRIPLEGIYIRTGDHASMVTLIDNAQEKPELKNIPVRFGNETPYYYPLQAYKKEKQP